MKGRKDERKDGKMKGRKKGPRRYRSEVSHSLFLHVSDYNYYSQHHMNPLSVSLEVPQTPMW